MLMARERGGGINLIKSIKKRRSCHMGLTKRKSWAPWAPTERGVGAYGAHGAQLGPIPDKKKSREKN